MCRLSHTLRPLLSHCVRMRSQGNTAKLHAQLRTINTVRRSSTPLELRVWRDEQHLGFVDTSVNINYRALARRLVYAIVARAVATAES
jgi:hypothetical protein